MKLSYFISMLGVLSIVIVALNIFLIIYLYKKIDNFRLLDKTILIPITIVIITFSLILTSNPTNVEARYDFCLITAIIEFLVHCFYQMKRYESPVGFYVAFLQNNLVLMTALVISLGGMVVEMLSEI